MRISDWSSDVCSSDLAGPGPCGRWRLSRRARRQLVLRAGRYQPGVFRGAAGPRGAAGTRWFRAVFGGEVGWENLGVGTVYLARVHAPGPGVGLGFFVGAAAPPLAGWGLRGAGGGVGG